jgi:hypothetical protein
MFELGLLFTSPFDYLEEIIELILNMAYSVSFKHDLSMLVFVVAFLIM